MQDDDRIFMLNTTITKIFLQLKNWDHSPSVLLDKFLEFIESSLATKVCFILCFVLFFVNPTTGFVSHDLQNSHMYKSPSVLDFSMVSNSMFYSTIFCFLIDQVCSMLYLCTVA